MSIKFHPKPFYIGAMRTRKFVQLHSYTEIVILYQLYLVIVSDREQKR